MKIILVLSAILVSQFAFAAPEIKVGTYQGFTKDGDDCLVSISEEAIRIKNGHHDDLFAIKNMEFVLSQDDGLFLSFLKKSDVTPSKLCVGTEIYCLPWDKTKRLNLSTDLEGNLLEYTIQIHPTGKNIISCKDLKKLEE